MLPLFVVLAGCAAASEVIARAVGAPGPFWALFSNDKFVLCTVCSVFLIHLLSARDGRERMLLLGIGLAMLAIAVATRPTFFRNQWNCAAWALALASVMTHGIMWYTRRSSFREAVTMMVCCWLLVAANANSMFAIHVSERFNPVFDPLLFNFEEGLGIRVASLAALTVAIPGVERLLYWIYYTLPVFMAPYFIFQKTARSSLPLLFVVSGPLGYLLYWLYPVVGPGEMYPSYYQSVWPVDDHAGLGGGAVYFAAAVSRATMPSFHMVWACFVLWNRHHFPQPVRWIFVAYAGVTVLAALVIGKHWFIDLVVALPVAAAMQVLFDREGARLRPVLLGAGMLALWLIVLRDPWFTAASPGWLRWLAIVATIGGTALVLSPARASSQGHVAEQTASD